MIKIHQNIDSNLLRSQVDRAGLLEKKLEKPLLDLTQKPQISEGANTKKTANQLTETRKVAEEFESIFLGIVLKAMRDTIPDSGLLSQSNSMKIYTSMLDDEYSKLLASNGHTGIAQNIENFLKFQNQVQGPLAYREQKERI